MPTRILCICIIIVINYRIVCLISITISVEIIARCANVFHLNVLLLFSLTDMASGIVVKTQRVYAMCSRAISRANSSTNLPI